MIEPDQRIINDGWVTVEKIFHEKWGFANSTISDEWLRGAILKDMVKEWEMQILYRDGHDRTE